MNIYLSYLNTLIFFLIITTKIALLLSFPHILLMCITYIQIKHTTSYRYLSDIALFKQLGEGHLLQIQTGNSAYVHLYLKKRTKI